MQQLFLNFIFVIFRYSRIYSIGQFWQEYGALYTFTFQFIPCRGTSIVSLVDALYQLEPRQLAYLVA